MNTTTVSRGQLGEHMRLAGLRKENERAWAEVDTLRAALWPFAMKALHGTSVCADDYRRAGEAMPHAPDHVQTKA